MYPLNQTRFVDLDQVAYTDVVYVDETLAFLTIGFKHGTERKLDVHPSDAMRFLDALTDRDTEEVEWCELERQPLAKLNELGTDGWTVHGALHGSVESTKVGETDATPEMPGVDVIAFHRVYSGLFTRRRPMEHS